MLGLFLAASLSLISLGSYGTTYKIAEPDVAIEIEQRAKNIDYDKLQKQFDQKFKNYAPPDLTKLSPAKKSRSYYVDMTYILDADIPTVDNSGKITGILYPKGYTFNPLDYMVADPPPLIVFNGERAAERKFVASRYKNDPKVMFVSTGGQWQKLAEEMNRPVYFLKSIMVKKLNLLETVSVVYKEGRRMRVDVYYVPDKGKN